jgi:hypothetical protein
MAMPFRFLNMLFCHYGSAWAMKSCAVDQSGLKCLQLLTGDDVVVNIDNHDAILSTELTVNYQRAAAVGKAYDINWRDGVRYLPDPLYGDTPGFAG